MQAPYDSYDAILPLAVCDNRQFSPQEKNSLLEEAFRRNSLSLFVIIAGNDMNYVTREETNNAS